MRTEHRVPRKHEMRTALMNAGYTVMQWSHSDLVCVISHFARRRGLTYEQMLDIAMEKAKIRETNPEYKK